MPGSNASGLTIMTKRKLIQLNRKWHRYLGVILGIQFFLWTLGGLYFSWTNIEEIRGSTLKKKDAPIFVSDTLVSPSIFTQNLGDNDSIVSLEVFSNLNHPAYRLIVRTGEGEKVFLFDAKTGQKLPSLSKKQSIDVAKAKLSVNAPITMVEYLTETGKHHEYRGRPLPAYAITFDEPANTTVYVSTEYGNVQTFRSNKWRVFDFFWMLHTMDYQERDNFNNLLLRAFALFGLVTILSGFSLYLLTSRIFNPKKSTK
ncbi:PepSY domain-containing protein [Flagellimonas sp. CMM7]|uniref:PepSY domain-containing protein n=1 Tax=Flagellimonas sp. CMM7 TaxID=2654676 RepID=UPI001969A8BF|nr:PepSY domain-containing protein [Flagellimonas sp. CMM7]UII78080.1 PepSY domain-containing protein [Flagellimonas sp. CMM7]